MQYIVLRIVVYERTYRDTINRLNISQSRLRAEQIGFLQKIHYSTSTDSVLIVGNFIDIAAPLLELIIAGFDRVLLCRQAGADTMPFEGAEKTL